MTDILRKKLHDFFGFETFKDNQERIIQTLLDGEDVFVLLPTGGGKSLCYQLPALVSEGTAIVISPLIALMKNQVDVLRGNSMDDSIAHFMNSSLKKSELDKVKADVVAGKTKLLYLAPEALSKEANLAFFCSFKISFFAIDEAHCISEWGHDFRPEYRRIYETTQKIGQTPIIALTATATPKVRLDIQRSLGIENAKIFKSSFNRPNLYYTIKRKSHEPLKDIIQYINTQAGKSGVIYCLSRKTVDEVAEQLQVNGISAIPYHAGLDSPTRVKHQDMFLMQDVDVVVATIAFGMGIDKPDIRYVIHYDIPKSLEGYYQETGRGGRDGGEGECVTFYRPEDIARMEKLAQNKPIAEQEITKQLLFDTMSYAESVSCRRKVLLNYFGEAYEQENCGNCDNCLNPQETFDQKNNLQIALNLVETVKERCAIPHLTAILVGEEISSVKAYKHSSLDVFGKGKDKDKAFWRGLFVQAIVLGLISKNIENYGLIKLTPKGKEFIQAPYSVLLPEAKEEGKMTTPLSGGAVKGGDSVLLKMLKRLRKDKSKELGVPPFVIFQDFSLDDMATQFPLTTEELQNIQGVGSGKANKYGSDFLHLIKIYVDDNEIERPKDIAIKTVANKSKNKISIIQKVDKKIALEEIAKSLLLDLDELLTEMEAIVNSGTKLDIRYFIEEVLDDEVLDDIYDYFQEDAETDSLNDAIDVLDEHYTEEEIRLVRLTFLSEIGN